MRDAQAAAHGRVVGGIDVRQDAHHAERDAFDRGQRGVGGRDCLGHEGVERVVEQHAVLAAEVPEERHVGDARRGGDLLDRDAIEAVLLEQVERGGLEALAGGGSTRVSH